MSRAVVYKLTKKKPLVYNLLMVYAWDETCERVADFWIPTNCMFLSHLVCLISAWEEDSFSIRSRILW